MMSSRSIYVLRVTIFSSSNPPKLAPGNSVADDEQPESASADPSQDAGLLRDYAHRLMSVKPPKLSGVLEKHALKRARTYLKQFQADMTTNFK